MSIIWSSTRQKNIHAPSPTIKAPYPILRLEMKATVHELLGALTLAMKNQACMWSEPDLVGWLEKRGGKYTTWKKRFFVLQGSYLFYFKDDFQVQEKTPLGVIPLHSSKVETKKDDLVDSSRRYPFCICLGKQFVGYSKRDTYIVAAPSHQAYDEWIQRLKISADTRESLCGKLRKARWRSGDLRKMLANSIGNQETLELAANKPEGHALMTQKMKVYEGIRKLEAEVTALEAQANQKEGALMRAVVVWDIFNHYLSSKVKAEGQSKAQDRVKMEVEGIQQLYGIQKAKASYLEGQKLEHLLKKAREKLRLNVEQALHIVQERRAKIRSKAPRYSFNLDPKIFYDDGEPLQPHFKVHTEEGQHSSSREVLETTEQRKHIKTTSSDVVGINDKTEVLSTSRDIESTCATTEIANPSMLIGIIEKLEDFVIEDAIGQNESEQGSTKQAEILSKEQRHSANFEDEELLLQDFKHHSLESQHFGLRHEVLEAAKQLENIESSTLKFVGINDITRDSPPSRDVEDVSANKNATNSSMQIDMIRRQTCFSIEDASGNHLSEQKTDEQVKILPEAPKSSLNLEPKSSNINDDVQSHQQQFKLHAQESQQFALEPELMERIDQVENIRTTALEVAEDYDNAEGLLPLRDIETTSPNRNIIYSNMPIDMIRQQIDFVVDDASGHHAFEQKTTEQDSLQTLFIPPTFSVDPDLKSFDDDDAKSIQHFKNHTQDGQQFPSRADSLESQRYAFEQETTEQTKLQILSKAPRFSVKLNSRSFVDPESLKQHFEHHTTLENRKFALGSDSLETAMQSENLKTTALNMAGFNKGDGDLYLSPDAKIIPTNREVMDSNMLIDMVRKETDFPVKDAVTHHALEQNTTPETEILFKAPIFSVKLNPSSSDDDVKSLQQHFKHHTTHKSKKFSLDVDSLETTKEPENLKTTTLNMSLLNERDGDLYLSADAKSIPTNRKLTNLDMVRKETDFPVMDVSTHHASEQKTTLETEQIQSKTPRYSFHPEPKNFGDHAESLQPYFKPPAQESRQSALKVELQLEDVGFTSQDNKSISPGRNVTNPNTKMDMFRKEANFSVEDTSRCQTLEQETVNVRPKALKYSYQLDPTVSDYRAESLQPHSKLPIEGSRPSTLRTKVMKAVEQLEKVTTTRSEVQGSKERVKNLHASQDFRNMSGKEKLHDKKVLNETNIEHVEFPIEDASRQYALEETPSTWIQEHQYETLGMQVEPRPQVPTGLAPQLPPQLPTTFPVEIPTVQSSLQSGMSQLEIQSSAIMDSRFQGQSFHVSQPIQRPLQPSTPLTHGFLPRGFQQQVRSMPQPPGAQLIPTISIGNPPIRPPRSMAPSGEMIGLQQGLNPPLARTPHTSTQLVVQQGSNPPLGRMQQGSNPPLGRMQQVSNPPLGGMQQRPNPPLDGMQQGSNFPLGGMQQRPNPPLDRMEQGYNPPLGRMQQGSNPPLGRMQQGSNPQLGRMQQGSNPPFGRMQQGSNPPFGRMQQGSNPLLGRMQQRSSLPLDIMKQGSNLALGRMQQGSSSPLGKMQQGSSPPLGRMQQGSSPPLGKMQQGSNLLVGGMQQGSNLPLGGMQQRPNPPLDRMQQGSNLPLGGMGGMQQRPNLPLDGMQQGSNPPLGRMQQGSNPALGRIQQGSNPPFERMKQGPNPLLGRMQQRSSPPLGRMQQGSNLQFGKMQQGSNPPLGRMQQGSNPPLGKMQQGSNPLLGRMQQGSNLPLGRMQQGSNPPMGRMQQGSNPSLGRMLPSSTQLIVQQGSNPPSSRMLLDSSQLRGEMALVSNRQRPMTPKEFTSSVTSPVQRMQMQHNEMQPQQGMMLQGRMQPMQPGNLHDVFQPQKARMPQKEVQPSHERIPQAIMHPRLASPTQVVVHQRIQHATTRPQATVQPMQGRMVMPHGAIPWNQQRMALLHRDAKIPTITTLVRPTISQQNHRGPSPNPTAM